LEDLVKEKQDLEISKKEKVRLLRPPRTTDEAIKTLKDADIRYEAGKQYLIGNLNKDGLTKKKKESYNVLENVPKGVTLSRLYYPPSKSEIVMIGVNRRAHVHSSFVYGKQNYSNFIIFNCLDFLIEMKPESVYI
jgi:hypothetical protein